MADRSSAGVALPPRKEVIRRFKQDGGRVAAVFPVHYPRALLRAHGMLPVEVWGPPGTDPSKGDAHLQAYTCSIVRCGLSFLLEGGLDVADALLVPHACDSLQGLGSVLIDFVATRGGAAGLRPVLTVYPPRGEGPAAVTFLADELRALSARLAELSGAEPAVEALQQAVTREERADALLAELYAARRRLPASSREFYRLVRGREYLPAEAFTEAAEAYLAGASDEPRRGGLPVLLSGLVPEPMALLDLIDEAGAEVVGDDLACCGRRVYRATDAGLDPFVRIAEGLLSAAPDSTRASAVDERVAHLRRLAARGGARAVIFYSVKFCEPEQFYLPLLRQALDRDQLRSVAVEIDLAEPLPDQIVTRIEALLETL